MSKVYDLSIDNYNFEVEDLRREYFDKSNNYFQNKIRGSYSGYLKFDDLATLFLDVLTSEYFVRELDNIDHLQISFSTNFATELSAIYKDGRGPLGVVKRKKIASLTDYDCYIYPAICRDISNQTKVNEKIRKRYIAMMIEKFSTYADDAVKYYSSLKETAISNHKETIGFIIATKKLLNVD